LSDATLQLNELFHSIQGESTLAGLPTVFVRFQGCNLGCGYCDTPAAREPSAGTAVHAGELIGLIEAQGCRHVCLTGGEPLLQRGAVEWLAARLAAGGHTVSLETNGSLPIAGLPDGLRRVVDLKTPGSGMERHNLAENFGELRRGDELKCVVTGREDFSWAVKRVREAGLVERVPVLVSPARGRVAADELAAWILESGLPLRLQLQLHRLVWPGGGDGRPVSLLPGAEA